MSSENENTNAAAEPSSGRGSPYTYVSQDGRVEGSDDPPSCIISFCIDYLNVAIQRLHSAREMQGAMLLLKQSEPELHVNSEADIGSAAKTMAAWLDQFHALSVIHKESCLVTIVFAALSLEALVNLYVVQRLSVAYLSKNLDKLEPLTKLIVAIRCVTGRDVPRGEQAMQEAASLVALRNSLIHFKPSITALDRTDTDRKLSYDSNISEGPSSPEAWMQRAESAVRALPAIEKTIQKADPIWPAHGCEQTFESNVRGNTKQPVNTEQTLSLLLRNILARQAVPPI